MQIDERDHRTSLVLKKLLGDEAGELAATHFFSLQATLSISESAAATPNGLLALETAANMMTRFIGVLHIVGPTLCDSETRSLIDQMVTRLRAIDRRVGKEVTLTFDDCCLGRNRPRGHLRIGASESRTRSQDVLLWFDDWTCELRRGGSPMADIRRSAIPFGALLGTCFGVAEVFKDLLIALEPTKNSRFATRRVHALQYSAWSTAWDHVRPPSSAVFSLDLNQIVLVGAGAVGNATAWAFANLPNTTGRLAIVDPKPVDLKNLNRCLCFCDGDVGKPKAKVLRDRLSSRIDIDPDNERFSSDAYNTKPLIVSTVDNNAVRHQMQETVPRWLAQGSTSNTQVCVSSHTAVDGLSCLMCRHPDPLRGVSRRIPLTVKETADLLEISEASVTEGRIDQKSLIPLALLKRLEKQGHQASKFLRTAHDRGLDLCGALGEFRELFGTSSGPEEPSVPFVSGFAGFQAAAEAVKLLNGVQDAPLRNVLTMDLAYDYTRTAELSYSEPARADCTWCQLRSAAVRGAYERKWGV